MSDITIYSLAKKLNMTPSMVSRALSPTGKISEEKRRIVLEAAQKYNYKPNQFASRLAMKPIRIGILILSSFSVNSEKMLSGIEAAHTQLKDYKIKYEVSVLPHESTDEEIYAVLEPYKSYDGIILAGMSASRFTEHIRSLLRENKNVVQVQAMNPEVRALFCSKHDEKTAAGLAAELLSHCLSFKPRKNILLFTGTLASALHRGAREAFALQCEALGMRLLSVVDMQDNEAYLESILPSVFAAHEGEIDGIYITSGLSLPLCRFLEKTGRSLPFVAFDTYEGIKEYLRRGIITAAVSQNVKHQMQLAFDKLVHHIITGEECAPMVYTDVQLMLRSNLHEFD